METVQITKRVINGKTICNKRFMDYDKGFYGMRISEKEYNETKESCKIAWIEEPLSTLNIVECIVYYN